MLSLGDSSESSIPALRPKHRFEVGQVTLGQPALATALGM